MYYIQESDKPRKLLYLLNLIRLDDDKIILPIYDEIISKERANILSTKTKKILDKTNCNKLVISKKIKEEDTYINNLYSYNYDIVDGRWLFKLLLKDVLEYIIKKVKNLKKEEIPISIVVNDISEVEIYNIKYLIKNYKKINIITNHIEKFKKLEDEILQTQGIMINVGNNKRKGMAKSKIILNLDFPSELINKYNISEDAIIINFQGNVKIKKKRFNGININDYEIEIKNSEDIDYSKMEKFYAKDIYEANQYRNQPIIEIRRKIKRDKVCIKKLIATNSEI